MASVDTPSADDVVRRVGLNRYIDGTTEGAFLNALEQLIGDAVVETALAVGESTYDSASLTARQATALELGVSYRAARMALNVPWLQKVTGTMQPLLIEVDRIAELQDHFLGEAERLESLANTGTTTQRFARPAVGASTFSVSDSDRVPSERNALTDERDDISAFDVDNG